MEKLITIIIPTYNMEALLSRTLDSLIVSEEFLSKIEVLVVNDGSTDDSSKIAHEYAEKFAGTIFVIDKENGHYGSCINAAFPRARGKYIRILDADDFYDTREFEKFLRELEKIDVDVVFSDWTSLKQDEQVRHTPNFNIEAGKVFSTEILEKDLFMWGITYKTEILHHINYRQTEGIMYTDSEWSLYPLLACKTAIYFPLNVYQYWLLRPGQSMSTDVWLSEKSCKAHEKIVLRMMDEFLKGEIPNSPYLREKFFRLCEIIYRYQIFFGKNPREELEPFENFFKKHMPEVFEKLNKTHQRCHFLTFNYIKFWRIFHKKHPLVNVKRFCF